MKKTPGSLPLLMILLGCLLLLVIAVWTVLDVSPAQPTNDPNIPYPDIARISLKDAYAAYNSKASVFLDVRDAGNYAASHIPGAINIPLAELADRLGELAKDAWIITYCT